MCAIFNWRNGARSCLLSISLHFERHENMRGSVEQVQSLHCLHANPRNLRQLLNFRGHDQNDCARSTLARIFPR